jgi:hypothetical protein
MPNHAASDTYIRATDHVVGGVPILMPANGPTADIETLLDRLDGIILTGSRSNVQPTLYNGPPHAEGTFEDPARDGITLPLIRPALMVAVIFRVMDALRVFDLVYVLTPNSKATKTMSVISRENMIDFDKFAYGAAQSTLLFAILAIFVTLYIWLGKVDLVGGRKE